MIDFSCKIVKIPLTFGNSMDIYGAFSIFSAMYGPGIVRFGLCLPCVVAFHLNASLNDVRPFPTEDDPSGMLAPGAPPYSVKFRIIV